MRLKVGMETDGLPEAANGPEGQKGTERMEQMTISEVSARFAVSTRTLRYWEQVGLIKGERLPGYAYRVYTEETVQRITQILVLRRLRIPLREIAEVLTDPEAKKLLDVLQSNIRMIDREADALQTVRTALTVLANRVSWAMHGDLPLPLEDASILALVEQLVPLHNEKEELKMNDLKKAEQTLEANMDIRYIYLPPMAVAAAQYTGPNPEDVSGTRLDRFVQENALAEKTPSLRVFGFNNPSPQREGETYGYEFWVTVPEDMEVPAPLVKKQFAGGLYAAHAIKMGDFHEWGTFMEKLQHDARYEIEWRAPDGMGGCMEEHLNAKSYYEKSGKDRAFIQLDLLIPIREKEA